MKKIILLAAIALFGVSAYAQNSTSKNAKVKEKNKEEATRNAGETIEPIKDVELTSEEKIARKADRKAEKDAKKASKEILKADRKADREDDGIINESNIKKDSHGENVSTIAKGTTLEGKEKGEAISTAARSKAETDQVKVHATGKPAKVSKSAKSKKTKKG